MVMEDILLSIVGGGSKQKLVNIAHKLNIVKHIKFEGPLARNQIFNWIDSLDIFDSSKSS